MTIDPNHATECEECGKHQGNCGTDECQNPRCWNELPQRMCCFSDDAFCSAECARELLDDNGC